MIGWISNLFAVTHNRYQSFEIGNPEEMLLKWYLLSNYVLTQNRHQLSTWYFDHFISLMYFFEKGRLILIHVSHQIRQFIKVDLGALTSPWYFLSIFSLMIVPNMLIDILVHEAQEHARRRQSIPRFKDENRVALWLPKYNSLKNSNILIRAYSGNDDKLVKKFFILTYLNLRSQSIYLLL